MVGPPAACPRCGARDSYARRYTTGGGWRRIHVCTVCGHTSTGTERAARVAVGATLAGALAAGVALVRRRLGG